MTAYLISICRSVSDRDRLEDYWAHAAATFEGFDAKPLVAYAPFEVLEGEANAKGIVLFEFPSVEAAKRWYFSDAYQEVKQRRLGAAEFELILVDGELTPAAERMPDTR
ncbi:MAG: hypothetical protein QOI79_4383 [Mycobacterium sp.]|jgi:uncharacterized protein (DUF1330 family)|nr:hypothetical protein [Mycobacterium sp.]